MKYVVKAPFQKEKEDFTAIKRLVPGHPLTLHNPLHCNFEQGVWFQFSIRNLPSALLNHSEVPWNDNHLYIDLGENQSNSIHLTKVLMEQSTSEPRGGLTDTVCSLTVLMPQE